MGARRKWSSFALLLIVLLPLSGARGPARAAETRLPFGTFFELYVDQPRRHVFVSGGSGTNGVLVYGFDGRLIERLGDLPGAADLLVEGKLMYVALSNSNAIAVIDLKTFKRVDTIDLSPYAQPAYLSNTRETIYFSYACDDHGGKFASVDLTTRVPISHDAPTPGGCAEHQVVPNDPNTMFVWDAEGMNTLRRYNVTARRPVPVDQLSTDYVGTSGSPPTARPSTPVTPRTTRPGQGSTSVASVTSASSGTTRLAALPTRSRPTSATCSRPATATDTRPTWRCTGEATRPPSPR